MAGVVLYDYWRSSASYRVRIALNLLGIEYEARVINLLDSSHPTQAYIEMNPQGLVPTLEIDGRVLTQSLAIIEYLNETRAEAELLPEDTMGRTRVRTLAYAIAMEIHPICGLRTIRHVLDVTGGDDDTRVAWMKKFIGEGLAAFDALLDTADTGAYCHGDTPTMADLCLIPQLYNAERWGADTSGLHRIAGIAETCGELKAFQNAHPDAVNEPD
jgi:maleylacetoacetate isomerase